LENCLPFTIFRYNQKITIMQRPYKIRFNLGKGKNYMKWKIEGPYGVSYHSPEDVQIHMNGCQLKNQRKTAEKINQGANKTVCAWVRCISVEIFPTDFLRLDEVHDTQLKYNPRKLPHWHIDENLNVDNLVVRRIITIGNRLYHKPDELEKYKNRVGGLK
jgi:hypothetical protein